MIATKGDIDLPGDGLGARLEELLRAYGDSVGDRGPAVPAELLQAATRIDESRAGIQQHGPADAVAGVEDEGDGQWSRRTSVRPSCTAALMTCLLTVVGQRHA